MLRLKLQWTTLTLNFYCGKSKLQPREMRQHCTHTEVRVPIYQPGKNTWKLYLELTPGNVFCSCNALWAFRADSLAQYVRKAQPNHLIKGNITLKKALWILFCRHFFLQNDLSDDYCSNKPNVISVRCQACKSRLTKLPLYGWLVV